MSFKTQKHLRFVVVLQFFLYGFRLMIILWFGFVCSTTWICFHLYTLLDCFFMQFFLLSILSTSIAVAVPWCHQLLSQKLRHYSATWLCVWANSSESQNHCVCWTLLVERNLNMGQCQSFCCSGISLEGKSILSRVWQNFGKLNEMGSYTASAWSYDVKWWCLSDGCFMYFSPCF